MTFNDSISIKGTFKTTLINFQPGLIEISGRSIPEDAITFFTPIVNWIDNYCKSPLDVTNVNIRIEYINSGSNRFIFQILKQIASLSKKGYKVNLKWFYEEDDDAIKNLGQDFQTLIDLPFEMIAIME